MPSNVINTPNIMAVKALVIKYFAVKKLLLASCQIKYSAIIEIRKKATDVNKMEINFCFTYWGV